MVFSFVGYKTVTVNYTDGKAVSVKMELETASLEEVQVVAYGAQKKRTVVSAISSVKADELKELPTHSLENLFAGDTWRVWKSATFPVRRAVAVHW